MLQSARVIVILFFGLSLIALLFACQANNNLESSEITDGANNIVESSEVINDEPAVVETVIDCPWDESAIIGKWVEARGAEHHFHESGEYLFVTHVNPDWLGTWSCAEGPGDAVSITVTKLREGHDPDESTERHEIRFDGEDQLAFQSFPITNPTFFREYTRVVD